ncbi:hypothetical protein TanjilG_19618 [Lupinus angustifolius]|uniref:Condensation domain-containing protein n=1 Tax=Lupinus angustifolius TaxID=3871 RepID=L0P0V6_LUPAN|nr:PREDICTED: uncharacterized protein LOC109348312 [Lupinus angustifolius]OIW11362.1 hypothetical protein TanjilG_19618 [Lupinus angustifolius]CCH47179.1 hypothetical protein [Lupinus angustifolius]
MVDPKVRTVGGTEHSWCKAVHGGTGIAVLALLSSKNPDISRFQIALNKLQNSHPILKTKLHSNTTTSDTTFTFITLTTPFVKIQYHNVCVTSKIFGSNENEAVSVPPFQLILEHELNQNTWHNHNHSSSSLSSYSDNMFVASIYAMPNATWVVVMRLHVAACDRTTAISLLRELLVLMKEEESENESEEWNKGEVGFAMEDLVPSEKGKKGIWAHGFDVLSYSVNSLRLTNLKFCDTKTTRFSQVVRLQLNNNDTKRVLDGCKHRRIKLCGALSAAGLMGAHSYKNSSRKYGIITLTDCRSSLQPPLSLHNFGFYHSAILNSHTMKGGESFWDLAKKTYETFSNSKNNNKHFTDMSDMNFLMCKAIQNPSLTSSSSLRTSMMSVFEDTVIDDGGKVQNEVGVEDYMGCASVHGVGPSIAIFDTIRDGRLDCICVYPAPLHSREQMIELVNKMKVILIEGGKTYDEE